MLFMELAIYLSASLGGHCRPHLRWSTERLRSPLPEKARVLKLVLTMLQKHSTACKVFPGGALSNCASPVPLGGPTAVEVLARPYFTRRLEMVRLLWNVRSYCEECWLRKLSAWLPLPLTKQHNAQCAQQRREQKEPSPSIKERLPRLKFTATLLCTHPVLSGCGGGKKHPDPFAADYLPTHRSGCSPTKPYGQLRHAKQALPQPQEVNLASLSIGQLGANPAPTFYASPCRARDVGGSNSSPSTPKVFSSSS